MRICSSCSITYGPDGFYSKGGQCRECIKTKVRNWRLKNPELSIARAREWRKNNPERAKANVDRWNQLNKKHVLLRVSKWQSENPDLKRSYQRKHQKGKSAYYAEKCATRRALKRSAMPAWANQNAIQDLYRKAAELSAETGIKHNVDHIVPLRSNLVCGLHVEHNLQVIPATENFKKNNRVWPGMPGQDGAT